MKGKIGEFFNSLQGEGIYFGEKQVFIRFFGCNLNCKYCDTKLQHYKEYEPQDLFEQLRKELKIYKHEYHSISFTGGEPLLQKDFLKEMLLLMHKHGYKNYLETNGTLPDALEEVIDEVDFVAMDLKLPSSTGLGDFWNLHRRFLKIASRKEVFLKTVICQSTTVEDLREGLKIIKDINKSAILVLQPNFFEICDKVLQKIEDFKDVCTKENVTSCFIPQVHRRMGLR